MTRISQIPPAAQFLLVRQIGKGEAGLSQSHSHIARILARGNYTQVTRLLFLAWHSLDRVPAWLPSASGSTHWLPSASGSILQGTWLDIPQGGVSIHAWQHKLMQLILSQYLLRRGITFLNKRGNFHRALATFRSIKGLELYKIFS